MVGLRWWMVAGLLAGAVGCGGGDSGDDDSAGVLPDSEGETESESDDDDDTGGAADDDDDDDGEPEEKLDVGTSPDDDDDDDESMEVCLGEEPAGDRLSLFGCEPCSTTTGLGSAQARWIVARVDVPTYPYRIDAIGAVVGGSDPTTLVYFERNSLIPAAEPVFESVDVEGSALARLHVVNFDEPLVIEENERLFVGVYLDGEDAMLSECAAPPDGDPQVWLRNDPPDVPWQALNGFTPQIFAYGEPL